MNLEADFEVVHTVMDFWDARPVRGIADFSAAPHFYECEWDDRKDDFADDYLLTPVDRDTLALALEDWDIWHRWKVAFHEGSTSEDSHPALRQDRARHEEIAAVLNEKLKTDPNAAVRRFGEFRAIAPPVRPGVIARLAVRWHEEICA